MSLEMWKFAKAELLFELRSGVGLVRTTDDAAEGNEARRGKGPARKEPKRG